jgi:4a-hydroxytetrahydrobiopterin dehydratase
MWQESADRLSREFQFPDFRTAWAFLTAVAAEAERRDHHPGIWNEYGFVRLELRSHDAGNCVTDRDHRLARAIDRIAAELGPADAGVQV